MILYVNRIVESLQKNQNDIFININPKKVFLLYKLQQYDRSNFVFERRCYTFFIDIFKFIAAKYVSLPK